MAWPWSCGTGHMKETLHTPHFVVREAMPSGAGHDEACHPSTSPSLQLWFWTMLGDVLVHNQLCHTTCCWLFRLHACSSAWPIFGDGLAVAAGTLSVANKGDDWRARTRGLVKKPLLLFVLRPTSKRARTDARMHDQHQLDHAASTSHRWYDYWRNFWQIDPTIFASWFFGGICYFEWSVATCHWQALRRQKAGCLFSLPCSRTAELATPPHACKTALTTPSGAKPLWADELCCANFNEQRMGEQNRVCKPKRLYWQEDCPSKKGKLMFRSSKGQVSRLFRG